VMRAALLLLLLVATATAQQPRPRLVVMISVDQLASWVLTDAWPWFSTGSRSGFHRLLARGTWFDRCAYRHAGTFTGPGHATFSTGADPADHGIIANSWYDRLTGQSLYCCNQPGALGVGSATAVANMGPRLLLLPTLGDAMKAHFGVASRVVSLSWKERSAIMMGGRAADVVAFADITSGVFVSTDCYGNALPKWLVDHDAKRPFDRWFGKRWTRGGPTAAFTGLVDDRPHELPTPNGKRTLPQVLDGGNAKAPSLAFYDQLAASPQGNEVLLELVEAAIVGERLGRDDVPDLLCVSFSANDVAGHRFGPRSVEIRDITLKTDRVLAKFLDILDAKVGLDRCAIVLTSDHGVAPSPEPGLKAGLDAGRGDLSLEAAQAANAALVLVAGKPPQGFLRWIIGWDECGLHLDRKALSAAKISLDVAARVAAKGAARAMGILGAVAVPDLLRGQAPRRGWTEAVRASVFPGRSPDVYFIVKPWWVNTTAATTHGTPHTYDREVPLFFVPPAGQARVRRGVRHEAISPRLAVVLLAEALGMPPPALATEIVPASVRP